MLDLETAAARLACHGDQEPCTGGCDECLVCHAQRAPGSLLCPTCQQAADD
jgi:hypothetical protein